MFNLIEFTLSLCAVITSLQDTPWEFKDCELMLLSLNSLKVLNASHVDISGWSIYLMEARLLNPADLDRTGVALDDYLSFSPLSNGDAISSISWILFNLSINVPQFDPRRSVSVNYLSCILIDSSMSSTLNLL